MSQPPVDIGLIIDELAALRAKHKVLLNEVQGVEEDIDKVKLRYREALESLGLTEARNKTHSATLVERVVPQVTNWDLLYAYIHENKFYHLLQRRPSAPGCAELFALGEIPGVEKFKKVDVSLRSL